MNSFWSDKTVLVTGHTGFKGTWLTMWLKLLGAKVVGLSLEPETHPAIFKLSGLEQQVNHNIADIRDKEKVESLVERTRPDVIFHLAAQPIVLESYENPLSTYQTNVMGTVNLLDTLKNIGYSCAVVFITSDKCYENKEWVQLYREDDELGGFDPYSSSKACTEIAISSYRRAFFNPNKNTRILISSARAGNVIGGGDWAKHRIIPDCMRSIQAKELIQIRNKTANRPWQHVLEPLNGYLILAQKSYEALTLKDSNAIRTLASAFNFGPDIYSNKTVEEVVKEVLKHVEGKSTDVPNAFAKHEAFSLNLSIVKAYKILNWKPLWNFERTIFETVMWYTRSKEIMSFPEKIQKLMCDQISSYEQEKKECSS
jgi:CDP-glucose 4,6-dehydratase